MEYVDGFVLPVPKKKIGEYKKIAKLASKVWRDHGALDYRECVADDVTKGKVTSFPRSVKAKPSETVVFAWITYKSRKQRDAVMKKVMADKRLAKFMDPKTMPFDTKRMFWGGFKNHRHLIANSGVSMMQTIVPYLTVNNAKEAIGFYAKALGAEEKACVPHEDGRILHADLSVNGGSVYLMDAFPEHAANDTCGAVHPPAIDKPSPTAIVVNFGKPLEVDAAFQRAVDAGCRGVTGPEDTFWNARFAVVCDPYGHLWMLNAELPNKS